MPIHNISSTSSTSSFSLVFVFVLVYLVHWLTFENAGHSKKFQNRNKTQDKEKYSFFFPSNTPQQKLSNFQTTFPNIYTHTHTHTVRVRQKDRSWCIHTHTFSILFYINPTLLPSHKKKKELSADCQQLLIWNWFWFSVPFWSPHRTVSNVFC